MTEKLFTGTLNKNQNKTKQNCHLLAKESKLNTGKLPAEGLPGNSVDYESVLSNL